MSWARGRCQCIHQWAKTHNSVCPQLWFAVDCPWLHLYVTTVTSVNLPNEIFTVSRALWWMHSWSVEEEEGSLRKPVSCTCTPHRWRRTWALPPPRSLSDILPQWTLPWQGSLCLPALHHQLWALHWWQHLCQMQGTLQASEWSLPDSLLWYG